MNLPQFIERWDPSTNKRLFFFAGGKDHDRLAMFYRVADSWRSKVDPLDFHRLSEPSATQLAEACRRDPLSSKYTVVTATEMPWVDPTENPGDRGVASLTNLIENYPRDLVLIMSSPEPNPLTKNSLAQVIIRKGYWVILKPLDEQGACELLEKLTHWPDETVRTVVYYVGTVPADLISFAKLMKIADKGPDGVSDYLAGSKQGHVFELTDAIVMRDVERALTFDTQDVPTNQLVGALDRKFSSLVQFMAEMKKGRSPKEAAMALRLPGFIVHGLYEASKRWTPAQILDSWPVLAEISLKADKPGANDLLIERLAK